jgi:hypothetical protein
VIALAHYDENTGQLLGVWLPPEKEDGVPVSFYLDEANANQAKSTVLAKGSTPTWDDWFDQLGDGLPYGGLLVSLDVPSGLGLAELFGMQVTY